MATSRPPAVIDELEPLTIDQDRGATHEKERLAVARLCHGMQSLYSQVKTHEATALRVIGTSPGDITFVCRLFQLIGFVSNEYAGRIEEVKQYRARVCGPVLVYRNKVAAHYALTEPRKEDNEADLYVSTMDTVAFETDRFFVGSLRAGLGSEGKSVQSQHDYHWSLTAFHESVVVPRLDRRVQR